MPAHLLGSCRTCDPQCDPEATPRGTRCVRDLMVPRPVTVTPQTTVAEAHALMQQRRIRHLPVLDNGRLVGMVTDRDIRLVRPSPATSLSVWELHYLFAQLTVTTMMTRFVVSVLVTCTIPEAVDLMLRHQIGALPVLERRQLVGILTRTDILRAFYRVHNEIIELSALSYA